MLEAVTSSRFGRTLVLEPRLCAARYGVASLPSPKSRPDRLRVAASAFLRGTTLGWGRRELADWLVCQYAPCAATPLYEESARELPASERTVDEGILERVILDARARALRLLGELVSPSQASPIARLAVACGTVVAQHDALGGIAYAPVGRKRMRLADRVASIFIADYLNHPHEYRRVTLCRECGELAFADDDVEHSSWCAATPEASATFAG